MVIFTSYVLPVSFAKPPMDKSSWNKRVRYQGGPSVSPSKIFKSSSPCSRDPRQTLLPGQAHLLSHAVASPQQARVPSFRQNDLVNGRARSVLKLNLQLRRATHSQTHLFLEMHHFLKQLKSVSSSKPETSSLKTQGSRLAKVPLAR